MTTNQSPSPIFYNKTILLLVIVLTIEKLKNWKIAITSLLLSFKTSTGTQWQWLHFHSKITISECSLGYINAIPAFDTIDHNVFLSRLEKENGVTADALGWMSSYLSGRQQCISINSTLSDNIDLHFGFPQGSRIGPFGFKLYTKPLTSIAKKHGINIHLYADDTQLCTSFKPEESEAALERLEACIEEIRNLMEANYLKLNDSKTEFVIFGTQKSQDGQ